MNKFLRMKVNSVNTPKRQEPKQQPESKQQQQKTSLATSVKLNN